MLSALSFTNFKSWANVELECGRITGVFGPNSSGKTSLIQFLLLLKQTKDATDRALSLDLNGDFVQFGSIRDAIHRHDEARSVDWSVEFELAKPVALVNPDRNKASVVAKGRRLSLLSGIAVRQGAPIATHLSYRVGGMDFRLAPRGNDPSHFDLQASPSVAGESDFVFVRTKGRPWHLPGPIKCYAFPDQARTTFQNAGFLADLETAYEAELDRIFYLGPLRDAPKRDYLWSRSQPSDVGQRGEKAIDAILAATISNTRRNLTPKSHLRPIQQVIAYWLRELGLIASFHVAEIAEFSNRWQARIKTDAGSSEVLLTDVGFGVAHALPVVTLLQYVPAGSTVILEQPEIHLHPLAQAGLADVIIQAAMHRKIQIILESHSEHLLLRLQRRIAEAMISVEDVRLYVCGMSAGASKLTRLEVDAFGGIHNWPDKFMGDAFHETAEAELARLHRLKAAE